MPRAEDRVVPRSEPPVSLADPHAHAQVLDNCLAKRAQVVTEAGGSACRWTLSSEDKHVIFLGVKETPGLGSRLKEGSHSCSSGFFAAHVRPEPLIRHGIGLTRSTKAIVERQAAGSHRERGERRKDGARRASAKAARRAGASR